MAPRSRRHTTNRRIAALLALSGVLCGCGALSDNSEASGNGDASREGASTGADASRSSTTEASTAIPACDSPPLLPESTSCQSEEPGARCRYALGDQPGDLGICTCVSIDGNPVWTCVASTDDAGVAQSQEAGTDAVASCDPCEVLDAGFAADVMSGRSDAASFACGTQSCTSRQLCVYAIGGGGPAQPCAPLDDAGGCPAGSAYTVGCPNLSGAPGCSAPVSAGTTTVGCIAIPDACGDAPTCACIPLGTCPTGTGSCVSVAGRSIMCAAD